MRRNRWFVLAVLCLAVFMINVDTTIVNVALPALIRQMGATTRELQWIVDAYTLAFAALVLAAGSLSDRFGRRGALQIGLAVFGLASLAGAVAQSPAQLTAARTVMGIGAAIIFPATLSILTNVFTERADRAKAIGIWGATTGVGVAVGPITGGWLLEHFWWGSVFAAMVPPAFLGIILVAVAVPTSKDPAAPRLDLPGLILSTAGIGTLVYTIIEAPENGWAGAATLIGYAAAAILLAAFVVWERRVAQPMIDMALFANLRFSAASGAVTVAFFALAGFIFMITQYFQFLMGYGPLETGLRMLPVAGAIAVTSVTGTRLAVRFGNRVVVAAGLALFGIAFLWISTASAATSYGEIVLQMLILGSGLGLTSAPATEAIMTVVPKDKAGIGSAVNDATRELGATFGVAVIGSVLSSLYTRAIDTSSVAAALPADVRDTAKESIGAALITAERIGDPQVAAAFTGAARAAFFDGFMAGSLVAAGVALAGAIVVAIILPGRMPARQEAPPAERVEPLEPVA